MNIRTNKKTVKRVVRHARIRAKIAGTKEMPRLAVYKSNKYIYAQLIDDSAGVTLAAASSMNRYVSSSSPMWGDSASPLTSAKSKNRFSVPSLSATILAVAHDPIPPLNITTCFIYSASHALTSPIMNWFLNL